LHRDVRAARRRQPVGQPEQLARCRAEGAYFLGTRARAGKPQAGSDRLLVHIEAAAHWVEHVHRRLLAARLRRRDSLREYPPRAPRRWQGRQFEVPTSRLGHNFLGLAAPILGPDLPRRRGTQTTTTYNSAGQVLTVRDALANTIRWEYDSQGNVAATVD